METLLTIRRPPIGEWRGNVTINEATGKISGKLDRIGEAQSAAPDPVKPAKPVKSDVELAAEWLWHEKELLVRGPVEKSVHDHRYSVCTGLTIEGKRVSPACQGFHKDPDETTGFCQLCSCGTRERARIGGDGAKLHCPTYKCPLERWGEMPGTGAQAPAAMARQILGVIKSAGAEVAARLGVNTDIH